MRVGLNYSPHNLVLMLTIYALAALPFFAGGLVVTLAISRLSAQINAVYAADLIGAAAGCLVLIPLLDRLGAPGVVLTAAVMSVAAALLFAPPARRPALALVGAVIVIVPFAGQLSGRAGFDVVDTKGHEGDRVLFSKWNSFSRIGVYERTHGDWSLSPAYNGPLPDTRFMDIDSAASTPILHLAPTSRTPSTCATSSRRWPISLKDPGFTALVIGPGGGRDLASALVFGARHVDGVEINPIIANDVMRDRFREFSGGIYTNPRVRITVDDGRSFVRRTPERYDVIQASLVDTWAATAAGAYTLTENTLYTVDAFNDYLDHLTDDGVLTITRWVFDGLRLVSLAQAACERRGLVRGRAPGDRPAGSGRDLPAEEDAVHRRGSALLRTSPTGCSSTCSTRPPFNEPPPEADDVGRRHADRRLRAAHPGARPGAVLRRAFARTSRRPPTTGRSSSTRRS